MCIFVLCQISITNILICSSLKASQMAKRRFPVQPLRFSAFWASNLIGVKVRSDDGALSRRRFFAGGGGGGGRTKPDGRVEKVESSFVIQRWKVSEFGATVAAAVAAVARTAKMAQRRGRATSRFTGQTRAASALCLCLYLLLPSAAEAGLYTASDLVLSLTPDNAEALLANSTAAIVVEFYASWCGHCVAFSPIYKKLARDIKGWYEAAAAACRGSAASWYIFVNAIVYFSAPPPLRTSQ